MKNTDTFAQRLRSALNYRNKKPIDLTNDAGLNKSLISQYLSGKFEAKNDKIAIIAKYLDVDPLYLMGWQDYYGSYSNEPEEYTDISLSNYHEIQNLSEEVLLSLLVQSTQDLNKDDIESILAYVQGIRRARGIDK